MRQYDEKQFMERLTDARGELRGLNALCSYRKGPQFRRIERRVATLFAKLYELEQIIKE